MQIDYLEIGNVIFRALISLFTLFIVTKILGKKQVSQLSLFDYVIGISIGNFAAEMTINTKIPYLNGILAVIVFGLVAYIISILTMKSIFLRRFLMGKPTVLIEKGEILIKGLRKVKFDINDMLQECRSNGYFDVGQIEYAVMEANGKISFLPKSDYKPITLKDMDIKKTNPSLIANIIIDGCLMKKAMKNMDVDEKWIKHELKINGDKLEDVLLGTLDNNKKLSIYKKNVNKKIEDVLE